MATVSFRIDDTLKQRLEELVERRGLNASHVFRQALEDKVSELQYGPDRGRNMQLSFKERLTFVNQFKVLAALNRKEDYRSEIEALESGYEQHYPGIFQCFSDGLSTEECREVGEILIMHSDLRFSYDKLKAKDKVGIEEHEVVFLGFDGNNEGPLMRYALYRINTLGFHESLKKSDLNSHMPTIGRYRRMLPVWRERAKPEIPPLSRADIRAILDVKYSSPSG